MSFLTPMSSWSVAIMTALLTLSSPRVGAEISRATVFTSGTEGYHTFRIPSVIRAANGTLVALAEGRRLSGGDSGDIDLVQKRSTDGGKTWGALEVIWNDGANTCGNPCPVLDESTGALWLVTTHNLGPDKEDKIAKGGASGSRTVWVLSSRDHGATWSAPLEITSAVKDPEWTWYATGPGVGIQIKAGPHAGRLVIPCDHNPSLKVAGKVVHGAHAIYSDDHGATWRRGEPIGADMNECQVVELADEKGTLLMDMRSYRGKGQRAESRSQDGGVTWTAPVDVPALPDPVCQASIVRWDNAGGRGKAVLLFSNPADSKQRVNFTVKTSLDQAATWSSGLCLHAGPTGYSCLVALDPDTAGCLYESGEKRRYETIVFARISARDLLSP